MRQTVDGQTTERKADFTTADRVALHELAARYANSIDDRDWDRFDTVFTDDCTYELRGFGRLDAVLRGRAAVRSMMEASTNHPVTHHVTNVEVLLDHSGSVRMQSKIAGILTNGSVGSADYLDDVVRTADGWRIATRVVRLRKAG